MDVKASAYNPFGIENTLKNYYTEQLYLARAQKIIHFFC